MVIGESITFASMKRFVSLFLLFLSSLALLAQDVKRVVPVPDRPVRKLVVADMETRVPIRKVVVTTKDGYRDSSNYRGIVRIPKDFDTLRVYKAGYLMTKLSLKEVGDTTFLIPSGSSLREVTVWGKDGSNRANENMAGGLLQAIREGAAEAPKGIASFDFASMLDRRGRRDRKHLKKVKAAFDKMDKLDDDPIVNAYLKDQETKRLKKEQQQAKSERDSLLSGQRAQILREALAEQARQERADSMTLDNDSLRQVVDTLPAQKAPGQPESSLPLSQKAQTGQSAQAHQLRVTTEKAVTDGRKGQETPTTGPDKIARKKAGR